VESGIVRDAGLHAGGIDMMIDQIVGRFRLATRRLCHWSIAAALGVVTALMMHAVPAHAQLIDCPPQIDLTKQKLPEIVSANGRLRGLLVLSDTQQSFQIGAPASVFRNCCAFT
jgi:hypothetical protein